jgi:hypothetical protein
MFEVLVLYGLKVLQVFFIVVVVTVFCYTNQLVSRFAELVD